MFNLTSDSLFARTILEKLDAITFAGNVNFALIKLREEAWRPSLPAGVPKPCQKPDFSGKLLFGDKLQQQTKKLNEQSKLRRDCGATAWALKKRAKEAISIQPWRCTWFQTTKEHFLWQAFPSIWTVQTRTVKLPGPLETLNAGNNSEASVNKKAGNLAKYKDKWSLITKNHLGKLRRNVKFISYMTPLLYKLVPM